MGVSGDVNALMLFFDQIVLNNRLPVFDYDVTWEPSTDRSLFDLVNIVGQDILVPVTVKDAAHVECKNAALKVLSEMQETNNGLVSREAFEDILAELSALDYRWTPTLQGEGVQLKLADPREQTVASYLLGGLLFGSYAQKLGGDHVLQAKRWRALLASGLQKERANSKFESHLFKELRALVQSDEEFADMSAGKVPWTPTFLPYLLSFTKDPTPLTVLQLAIDLRQNEDVGDYRAWLKQANADFEQLGRIPTKTRKSLNKVKEAVLRKIGDTELPAPAVGVEVTAEMVTNPLSAVKLNLTPYLAMLGEYFVAPLQKQRYRRLLVRALAAHKEYVYLERSLRDAWERG
ncbi:hypothetical protein SAMN05660657_05042 [Geodermatophilus amargosae]|uniref:Uncharacterized protein n=2 Tax=Geodermatophilus amargosae TaxID=1296565 RepID=A0A1I7CY69_9ACTN|nr:hypothetical protein SAMN05660657_05042 [Geodermatophilus amargosae]